jgi:hypothetical protein
MTRHERGCRGNELLGLFRIAPPKRDKTDQMQCVGIARLHLEDARSRRARMLEPACREMRAAKPKQFDDVVPPCGLLGLARSWPEAAGRRAARNLSRRPRAGGACGKSYGRFERTLHSGTRTERFRRTFRRKVFRHSALSMTGPSWPPER